MCHLCHLLGVLEDDLERSIFGSETKPDSDLRYPGTDIADHLEKTHLLPLLLEERGRCEYVIGSISVPPSLSSIHGFMQRETLKNMA